MIVENNKIYAEIHRQIAIVTVGDGALFRPIDWRIIPPRESENQTTAGCDLRVVLPYCTKISQKRWRTHRLATLLFCHLKCFSIKSMKVSTYSSFVKIARAIVLFPPPLPLYIEAFSFTSLPQSILPSDTSSTV